MFLCGCEEKPEPDPQGSEEAPTTLLVGTAVGTALLFVALMYLAYTAVKAKMSRRQRNYEAPSWTLPRRRNFT
ncbi:hypothetical protein JYU34_011457 [Plutella xylostella]|uniref:Uncharacterized protein n=1 Tax=Plutella xylostella TaxID=51655 RepID=A0ABQ7QKP5_PLUXY|nr:hypothetical protein JYU34_011457 [Plutella xylostella]